MTFKRFIFFTFFSPSLFTAGWYVRGSLFVHSVNSPFTHGLSSFALGTQSNIWSRFLQITPFSPKKLRVKQTLCNRNVGCCLESNCSHEIINSTHLQAFTYIVWKWGKSDFKGSFEECSRRGTQTIPNSELRGFNLESISYQLGVWKVILPLDSIFPAFETGIMT